MIEKKIGTGQEKCLGIGENKRQDQIMARDLMISLDSKHYIITVGTPQYLADLKSHHRRLDASSEFDEKIYILDDVSDVSELCRKLLRIPFEDLSPYLVEQNEPEV